jgi:sterol desaturase/sphingolipid hydroxylase (fatty acid hydroxylase superfamily)
VLVLGGFFYYFGHMDILRGVAENFGWYLACMVIFTLLARLFACNRKEDWWYRENEIDLFYWLIPPLLYRVALVAMLIGVLMPLYGFHEEEVAAFIKEGGVPAQWPIWIQIILILLISDFIQYWIHRGFHGAKMWRFHAIHHAPEHVTWSTSVRFHPVNYILYATLTAVITIIMGFGSLAFAALAPFNILYSCMVHANLSWTFGPLRYVFASPVFHRWHHTHVNEGGNKNFAPTFPFIDMMFGTFYMPEGKLPEVCGIEGNPVPKDLVGQMAYPFRNRVSEK